MVLPPLECDVVELDGRTLELRPRTPECEAVAVDVTVREVHDAPEGLGGLRCARASPTGSGASLMRVAPDAVVELSRTLWIPVACSGFMAMWAMP